MTHLLLIMGRHSDLGPCHFISLALRWTLTDNISCECRNSIDTKFVCMRHVTQITNSNHTMISRNWIIRMEFPLMKWCFSFNFCSSTFHFFDYYVYKITCLRSKMHFPLHRMNIVRWKLFIFKSNVFTIISGS